MNPQPIEQALHDSIPALAPAVQLVVRRRGEIVVEQSLGRLNPEQSDRCVTSSTRFDLASVTKVFTTTAFMRLVDQGRVELDDPVCDALPDLQDRRPIRPYEDPMTPGAWVTVGNAGETVDAGKVTFRHLLSHSSGLPAWRPLYRQPSPDAARRLALTTFFSYPIGADSVYSDIGLILLGMAVEQLSGLPLDEAMETLVCIPLGLPRTGFLVTDGKPAQPAAGSMAAECAATEFCPWRGRRILGQVHDENAYRLTGIAGHAGLFSTAADVAKLGQIYLDDGEPLLRPATVKQMRSQQVHAGPVRRGLGFALRSPDPESSGFAFGANAFGHTGFTGTSLWIDPGRDLVVALLSNEVYNGRNNRRIADLRASIHDAVVQAVGD